MHRRKLERMSLYLSRTKAATVFKAILVLLAVFMLSKLNKGLPAFPPGTTVECGNALNRLRRVQLVVFDFDETIIDIHTGGRWTGDPEELAPRVREEFKCLINGLLYQGKPVCVGTFSTQTKLISKVLELSFPDSPPIPVYGGSDQVEGLTEGKQSQLSLCMRYYEQSVKDLRKEATLLIDDDPDNIKVAREDGYKAIQYRPEPPMRSLYSMLK
jgi:hypothetical protein